MSGERKYVKISVRRDGGLQASRQRRPDYDYSSVPHDDGQGWVEICWRDAFGSVGGLIAHPQPAFGE